MASQIDPYKLQPVPWARNAGPLLLAVDQHGKPHAVAIGMGNHGAELEEANGLSREL